MDLAKLTKERVKAVWSEVTASISGWLESNEFDDAIGIKLWNEYGVDVGDFKFNGQEINDDTQELILSLMELGTAIQRIQEAYDQSHSAEEFANALKAIATNSQEAASGLEQITETTVATLKDVTSNIAAYEKLAGWIETLQSGEELSLDDMLGIAESNPELLMFVDRADLLQKRLQALHDTQVQLAKDNMKEVLWGDEAFLQGSPYASFGKTYGATTLGELRDFLNSDRAVELFGEEKATEILSSISTWLDGIVEKLFEVKEASVDAWESFTSDVDTLEKAKSAMDAITKTEGYSRSGAVSAINTLADLFDLDPRSESFLEDAQRAIDALENAVRDAADTYGLMSDEAAEAAETAKKSAEEQTEAEEKRLQAYRDMILERRHDIGTQRMEREAYHQQLDFLNNGDTPQRLVYLWESLKNSGTQDILIDKFPDLAAAIAQVATASGDASVEMEAFREALEKAYQQSDRMMFEQNVENLQKAKKALEDINKTEGYSYGSAVPAQNTLADLFGLDVTSPTFLDDAKTAVAALEEEVNQTAAAYGVMTEEAAKANQEAEAAAKTEEGRLQAYRDVIWQHSHENNLQRMEQETYHQQLNFLNADTAQRLIYRWESLNSDTQGVLAKQFPELAVAIAKVATASGDATDEMAAFREALADAQAQADRMMFEKNVDDLKKAKAALEDMTQTSGYSSQSAVAAQTTLAKMFGLDTTSTTFIDDARAAIEALEASVNQTSEAYGVMTEEAAEASEEAKKEAEAAAKAMEERMTALKKYLDTAANEREVKRSSQTGFSSELQMLSDALDGSGMASRAVNVFKGMSAEMQDAIKDTYPKLYEALVKVEAKTGTVVKRTQDLKEALKDAQWQAGIKYFKESAQAIQDLGNYSTDAVDAMTTFNDEMKTMMQAQEEMAQISDVSKATTDNVKHMAEALNWTPEAVLTNWDQAVATMDQMAVEAEDIYNAMNREIFLNITGTSDADFSNIQNGMFAVSGDADALIAKLLALGNYEIVEEPLDGEVPSFDVVDGKSVFTGMITERGKQTILRLKDYSSMYGTSREKPASTGGGGGGGGKKQDKTKSASTKMLESLTGVEKVQSHTQSMLSAQASYAKTTGDLEGYIQYATKQREAMEAQLKTMQETMPTLEKMIAGKKAEVAALKEGSTEYDTAKKELDALEDKYREYDLSIVQTRTDIYELGKAIDDVAKQIRELPMKLALEAFAEIEESVSFLTSLYSAQASYGKKINDYYGFVTSTVKQRDALKDDLKMYQEALPELEKYIVEKEKELSLLKVGTEEYDKVKGELKDLKSTHQDYTLAIIETKSEIYDLNKAIEDTKKEIRDMQLELLEEVEEALRAQDEKLKSMREGYIAVRDAMSEAYEEAESHAYELLSAKLDVEQRVLDVLMKQKDAREAMRDGTIALADKIEALLKSQEDHTRELSETRVSAEQEVLKAIEESKALWDRVISGRIAMEKTVLDILLAEKDLAQSMRDGRVQTEQTILDIIKAQVETEKKLLSAAISAESMIAGIITSSKDHMRSMRDGYIAMEDTIFGLIKARYQTEQKEAEAAAKSISEQQKKANQDMIAALQKQKDILDEQLKLRKQQAQEQDKAVELAELEAKYARISADPTRMKEALEIRKKIDDLRDEIAWDTAEKEVERQKKAIDEKIEALQGANIPDTSSSVTAYYQEIYDHPTKIIAEVAEIMKMTDDELIEWLKKSDESYAYATDAKKEKMEEDWRAMLRTIHGTVEDTRDEVARILAMSDDEILAWMREHDEDYRWASEKRRKQMEQEWRETLQARRGEEETYMEEVARIAGMTDDEIMKWLKENDEEYLKATKDVQAQMEQSWKEMLQKRAGTTDDYSAAVAAVLDKDGDEIITWLMEHDKTWALASDATRRKMVKEWRETLDDMYGITTTYWGEIDSILSQPLDEFLLYMERQSTTYGGMSPEQQKLQEETWTDLYRRMHDEEKSYVAIKQDILSKGLEGYLDAVLSLDREYQKVIMEGDRARQAQIVQQWTEMYQTMHGITVSYWDQVEQVMSGGFDGFMEFMKQGPDYLVADEAERAQMLKEWADAWAAMDPSKDPELYRRKEEIAKVMSEGYEAFLEWMKTYSIAYQEGDEQTKASMVATWEDMWRQMTGKEKDYEDEALSIISQGTDAILKFLGDSASQFQDKGRMQADAYTKEWKTRLQELETAFTTFYSLAGIDFSDIPDIRLANSAPTVSVPDALELGNVVNDWSNSLGNQNFGDIIVQVDNLDTDADYDEMAEHVMASIAEKLNRGAAVGGIRYNK